MKNILQTTAEYPTEWFMVFYLYKACPMILHKSGVNHFFYFH